MTESGREERVQESGVVGHSFDTDDRLGDLDIYEALINPHDEQGAGQKGGAGGPMMMPMGGSGSGSSTGTSAAAGTGAVGAARGTSAASAGAGGGSGFSGTGVSGLGGAAYAPSGLGAGSLSGVGGAGLSGLSSPSGTGGLSGSGSSWGIPSFGTSAAGLTDPTLDRLGTAAGTTPTGGFTVPTLPTTPTQTIPTPTVPAPTAPSPNPGGASSPITMPSSAGGAGMGMPSGGGGASASTATLGVQTVTASPEMLHKEAQHWDDTSKEFTADVTIPIGNQSPSSIDFGMMRAAFDPYNALLNRLKKWSTEAGAEFSAISDALQLASGGYSDTENTNTATARQVQTTSNIPE